MLLERPAPGKAPLDDVVFDSAIHRSPPRPMPVVARAVKHGINVVDGLPVISQLKSLVVLAFEGPEAAREVQEHFADTWMEHKLELAGDLADSLPVIGHIKGMS